mgnify:CR=1 FL=1
MSIEGVLAKCACEDYEYSLANGQLLNPVEGGDNYPMINYRITKAGDVLSITNNSAPYSLKEGSAVALLASCLSPAKEIGV